MENNEDNLYEYDFKQGRNKNLMKFIAMILLIFIWIGITVAGTYAISSFVTEWFSTPIIKLPYIDDNMETFLK